jgi:hypothetical protein
MRILRVDLAHPPGRPCASSGSTLRILRVEVAHPPGHAAKQYRAGLDLVRNAIGDGTEPLPSASLSRTWVDPIIIARFTEDINRSWN